MSEPLGSHYAADFTSVQTNIKRICENCGNTAVLKHMHSKNPEKLGRDLCPDCYQYYCNKHTSVRRSSAQIEGSADHQRMVHKHVAQAQRGHT